MALRSNMCCGAFSKITVYRYLRTWAAQQQNPLDSVTFAGAAAPLTLMTNSRRISVDISLYPLSEDFKTPILEFIRKLKSVEGLEVQTNPLSTQVHGEFGQVWSTLGELLLDSFGDSNAPAQFSSYLQVAVLKIVSVDVTE